MGRVTFITGGAKSAKSIFALKLALQYKKPRVFIATALAFDDEMKKRIDKHKKERMGEFDTIEEPIKLSNAIGSVSDSVSICVVDCVTVWINNILYYKKAEEVDLFIELLKNPPCDIIVVSNEVGMGIVPDNELSRRYRDLLGVTNRKIAKIADNVILMISGIPVYIKKGDILYGTT